MGEISSEELSQWAGELLERDDLLVLTPTDSFVSVGSVTVYELSGHGVDQHDDEQSILLLLYDDKNDIPALVVVPKGVGNVLAEDFASAEEHIKLRELFGEVPNE